MWSEKLKMTLPARRSQKISSGVVAASIFNNGPGEVTAHGVTIPADSFCCVRGVDIVVQAGQTEAEIIVQFAAPSLPT